MLSLDAWIGTLWVRAVQKPSLRGCLIESCEVRRLDTAGLNVEQDSTASDKNLWAYQASDEGWAKLRPIPEARVRGKSCSAYFASLSELEARFRGFVKPEKLLVSGPRA